MKLIVFTDLDGTFLDLDTYSPEVSIDAMKTCKSRNIPIIFVSSKTAAEIQRIRTLVENLDPFVSENGGGIYLPSNRWPRPENAQARGDYWCITFGTPYRKLTKVLKEAAEAAGIQVKGFAEMTEEEVSAVTGLSKEEARLAKMREFDEVFITTSPEADLSGLWQQIRLRGLNHTSGGRFHHILGENDKGKAVRWLSAEYGKRHPGLKTAAIGDGANDLPMLRAVEHPFLVRKPGGDFEREAFFTGVTVTKGIGPDGFAEAVACLLD